SAKAMIRPIWTARGTMLNRPSSVTSSAKPQTMTAGKIALQAASRNRTALASAVLRSSMSSGRWVIVRDYNTVLYRPLPRRTAGASRHCESAGRGSRLALPGRQPVAANEILVGLTWADDGELVAFHHDFRHKRPGIV